MLSFRSRTFQTLVSIGLACVCLACYVLILILYLKPEAYNIQSLVRSDQSGIKPTVAVSLVALLLNFATVTLVSRCVEHSLWIRLATEPTNEDFRGTLTIGETRRLAQWCTSNLEKLLYIFGGLAGPDKRSWLLRISGPLLVATGTVGPVLLVGISQSSVQTTTTETIPRAADPWESHLDSGNVRYRGGNSFDNPTFVAALAAMRNLSAPVAPYCADTTARSTCSVSARVVTVKASCAARSQSNPNEDGVVADARNDTSRFCTGSGTATEICVGLLASSPATYSMFKSGPPSCSSRNITDCPTAGKDGQWAKIFGVWVNGVDISTKSEYRLNFVDCDLTYGNITVRQNGTSAPYLDHSSYQKSESTEAYQFGFSNYSIIQLNRIYTELGNSPYDWALRSASTGANTIYASPIAFQLLGRDANNDAETVARQIEANFEMATLHSFARGSNSSDLVFTRSVQHPIYVYNKNVLLILLVPFFATVLGCWSRWRIGGEATVVGYDPVGIARLGPVSGLSHGPQTAKELQDSEEPLKVWRWSRESVDQFQRPITVTGMQVFDPRTVDSQEGHVVLPK